MLNTALNAASDALSDGKDKFREVAKSQARAKTEQEIRSMIPNPNDLRIQLEALQTNDDVQAGLLKAEQVYNKFISLIDKAIAKLESAKAQLEGVKGKFSSVTRNLDIFDNIVIPIARNILRLAKGILVGFDAKLAANSSTLANGLDIHRTGKKRKDLEDNLKKIRASIEGFPATISFFDKELDKFLPLLADAISNIEERIRKLKELRAQLVSIYTQFISSLAIPELNDENIPNENLEDYISDEDNLNTIISDQLDIGNITEAQDSNRTDTDPLDVDPEETPPIIPKSIIYKKFNQ